MADRCWLNEEGALVDYSDVAPAPCKDFYHVFATPNEIIFRYWKIVPPTRTDANSSPVERRDSYDDFIHDDALHSEIQRLAGDNTLQYLISLAKGHVDFLPRLPEKVLLKIISYLDLEDIMRVSSLNKQFRELANDDDLWEKIYKRHSQTLVTPELEDLAKQQGWKRLFYTNKLQLQMQLRRQKRHADEHHQEEQMEQSAEDEQQFLQ